MGRVDIEFLYNYLVENQKLDPAIARQILLRILEILQGQHTNRDKAAANCNNKQKYSKKNKAKKS